MDGMIQISPWTALIGAVMAIVAFHFWRRWWQPTREAQLSKRILGLESTVEMLLEDRDRDRLRILDLEAALGQAQREIVSLSTKLTRYESGARNQELIAAVGLDTGLQIDLAALRGSGLRVTRIFPVSKAGIERTLNRRRANGHPASLLHVAAHAGPAGIQCSDGVADGLWLSEQLAGIDVMVIAGCESDETGDMLAVVPHVVTMREQVDHDDARIFATVFWESIAEGLTPDDALARCDERCPPGMMEFVERHW